MRLRFAIWESGPIVYFSHGARAQIAEMWGPSPRIKILLKEHSVELHRSPNGTRMIGSSEADLDDWPFRLIEQDDFVARSGIFEVSFRQFQGHLVADIPPPHELPWPFYHEYEEGEFDKHEALVREIRVRQDSAERHQVSRNLSLPSYIQGMLTAAERVRYFQEFQI